MVTFRENRHNNDIPFAHNYLYPTSLIGSSILENSTQQKMETKRTITRNRKITHLENSNKNICLYSQ